MSDQVPFLPPGSASIDDFAKLDLRVGRVMEVRPFPKRASPRTSCSSTSVPPGQRQSSAQLPGTYPDPAALRRAPGDRRRELPAAPDCLLHQRGAGPRGIAGGRPHPAALGRRGRLTGRSHRLTGPPSVAQHDTPREYARIPLRGSRRRANVCRPGSPRVPRTPQPEPTGRGPRSQIPPGPVVAVECAVSPYSGLFPSGLRAWSRTPILILCATSQHFRRSTTSSAALRDLCGQREPIQLVSVVFGDVPAYP